MSRRNHRHMPQNDVMSGLDLRLQIAELRVNQPFVNIVQKPSQRMMCLPKTPARVSHQQALRVQCHQA
eukprot:4466993-Amphidinium_carterae.1